MILLGGYNEPVEDYWHSEHHRVEFSALRPYLDELDPNSLHQVGIAVPGNYVEKRKLDDLMMGPVDWICLLKYFSFALIIYKCYLTNLQQTYHRLLFVLKLRTGFMNVYKPYYVRMLQSKLLLYFSTLGKKSRTTLERG